jgi:transcriptional regulator with XRE-family HTH domain
VDREEAQKALEERRRDYFKRVRNESGLKTMKALAEALGVTQGALSNIASGERDAGDDLIGKIRDLTQLVGDGGRILARDARDKLVEPAVERRLSLGERLDEHDRQRLETLRKAQEADHQNIENIRQNFEAMDSGDVFIFVSAKNAPLEIDPDKDETAALRKTIAGALQRHAFFIYLMPTKKYLQEVGEWQEMSDKFAKFKERVLDDISDKGIRGECHQRLLLLQTDETYFFRLPHFKWELFLSDTIDGPYKARASILAVAGYTSDSTGPSILMRLTPHETKEVVREITRTICLANPKLPVTEQVPTDVITRLTDNEARLSINRAT